MAELLIPLWGGIMDYPTKTQWDRLTQKVDELHKAILGNGQPEKSLLSRVAFNEKTIKAIVAIGVLLIGAAFAAALS